VTYLPFIDGLRAVAILAVVAYHAFPRALPGGFAGVDVFFVVSGFLITRFIYHEINERHFSFPSFLVRRARRLLPAAVVCLTLTLAIGYFVLPPAGFQDLGRSLVATVLMYANFFFYRLAGYFSPQASELPLLHTWSLAVEEQFYLLFPLLLLLLLPRRNGRQTLVLSLLALLSFALSAAGVSAMPSATFYLVPTRAWELLLGALLAAGAHLAFSFGGDMPQTRALLHRGFAGDWILTGRHAAGDAEPDVLPDPGPVSTISAP
jgi:peptidoglycan/LPS O-acetylase OafA/YrhL